MIKRLLIVILEILSILLFAIIAPLMPVIYILFGKNKILNYLDWLKYNIIGE